MSLYTTGELAKKCNVSVRTIQYYDERGILVPTDLTEGGRRLFSEKDVATLETICFLRDLDISIKDIAEILESDESKKVIELLLDELNKNLQADIKKNMQLNYILDSKHGTDISEVLKKKRVALVLHFYFEDLAEYCLHYVQSMPKEADIYVTVGSEKKKKIKRNGRTYAAYTGKEIFICS